MITRDKAQATVEDLYKDLERRIVASPPGLCPVDLASSFPKIAMPKPVVNVFLVGLALASWRILWKMY